MKFGYIGEKIQELREEQFMSRELLARMCRITPRTIHSYERQERAGIPEVTIEYLARALGVDETVIAPQYTPPQLPYVYTVRYCGADLRTRRQQLGLSLADVAKRSGLTLDGVSKIERKDTARPESIRRLASALGLRLEDVSPAFKIRTSPEERAMFAEWGFDRPETHALQERY